MPRRNTPRRKSGARKQQSGEDAAPLRSLGSQERESGPDGEWSVRRISGAAAIKHYRCPGCYQEIPPGMAHVVTWPADTGGTEDRRHWHTSCWSRRLRRSVRYPRRN